MRPYADINGDFHCPECGALLVDFDEADPLCRGCCESMNPLSHTPTPTAAIFEPWKNP